MKNPLWVCVCARTLILNCGLNDRIISHMHYIEVSLSILLKVNTLIKCDPSPLLYTHVCMCHSLIPWPLVLSVDSMCRCVPEPRTTPSVSEMYTASKHPRTRTHTHLTQTIYFFNLQPEGQYRNKHNTNSALLLQGQTVGFGVFMCSRALCQSYKCTITFCLCI